VRFPGEADPRARRARALRDLGQLEAALADYRAALALQPAAPRYAQFGKELWDAGARRSALVLWEDGLTVHPADILLLRNAGFARYDARDNEGAERLYRRAIAAAPSNLAARTDLGFALLAGGKTGEASEICAEVLRIDPGNAAASAILGRIPAAGPAGKP
jgi:tetratricopeptide (TPR) repeat protein